MQQLQDYGEGNLSQHREYPDNHGYIAGRRRHYSRIIHKLPGTGCPATGTGLGDYGCRRKGFFDLLLVDLPMARIGYSIYCAELQSFRRLAKTPYGSEISAAVSYGSVC